MSGKKAVDEPRRDLLTTKDNQWIIQLQVKQKRYDTMNGAGRTGPGRNAPTAVTSFRIQGGLLRVLMTREFWIKLLE